MSVIVVCVVLVLGVGVYLGLLRSKSSAPGQRVADEVIKEAEFHMAYKLYSQATTLVEEGLQAHTYDERLLALRRKLASLVDSTDGSGK
jgi:hypothetical protein